MDREDLRRVLIRDRADRDGDLQAVRVAADVPWDF
jgi:hypothetical protein